MSRLSMFIVLALAACLGSCASELPTAPDLQPVLQAYANPTAVVDGAIMDEYAQQIEDAAREIEDSKIFDEILDLIKVTQQEVENAVAMTCQGGAMDGKTCNTDENCQGGTCTGPSVLVIGGICSGGSEPGRECAADGDCPDGACAGGITLPNPTGAFRLNYICPGLDPQQFDDGYDENPDPANGSLDLFATLDSEGLGRVVWGTAAQCLYLVPNEGDNCEADGCSEASYDGSVALDLGDDWLSQDIERLDVTFVVQGTIGFAGEPFNINQSFRVRLADESDLTLLVDVGDPALSETFNYIFEGDVQRIQAANGEFGCSLQDSQCSTRLCDGGANAGSACTTNADCPEGTCVLTSFSW